LSYDPIFFFFFFFITVYGMKSFTFCLCVRLC
jgi:hypothetical protein